MFDIFLLPKSDAKLDSAKVLDEMWSSGALRRMRKDPCRHVYRNDDTGVAFEVLLAPALLRSLEADASDAGDGFVPSDPDPTAAAASDDERAEAGEGLEDEEDGPHEPDIEIPPITIHVPVLRPTFYALEAIALAERLRDALDLTIEGAGPPDDAREGGSGPDPAPTAGGSAADLLETWREWNRKAMLLLEDRSLLTVWPPEKSADWWAYGRSRKALEAELGPEGVAVPSLLAARHGGTVKTLCIWEEGTPTVLPRVDLVIVRRERRRRRLLGLRRSMEEGIAPGERLRDILAPSSEVRADPAGILIFRDAAKPASQVAARLEVLGLEPIEAAKRTELVLVVDMEVPSGPAMPGSSPGRKGRRPA